MDFPDDPDEVEQGGATEVEDSIRSLKLKLCVLEERIQLLQAEAASVRRLSARITLLELRLTELRKPSPSWGAVVVLLPAVFLLLGVVVGALLSAYLDTNM